MLNTVEINKLSRAIRKMDLGGKLAALVSLANGLHDVLLNHAKTAAGLTIGSSDPAKVKIANTVTFLIGGVFKSKTTAEVAFTATTHDIAPHATLVKECVYLLSLKADGTAIITKGVIATGAGTALIPSTPASQAAIGHVRVAVAAGATLFDASSDALNAGHLTVTYTDVSYRPDDLTALVGVITA